VFNVLGLNQQVEGLMKERVIIQQQLLLENQVFFMA
jgi:hypothetical protein